MESIHHSTYISLVQALKERREGIGLTQSQLGEKLRRDQTFVSKYESRERRLDVIEVRDICRALDVPLIEVIALLEMDDVSDVANSATDESVEDCEMIETVLDTTVESPRHFISATLIDREWSQTEWQRLINWFVDAGILNYREIGSLMLGHLNPPQVGTSIASKTTFQGQFAPRKTWQAVKGWFYEQSGKCQDCGTRLELQADHVVPRQDEGDKADRLGNMTLRCRRCNVIRRPSHKKGGQTFLTAEAALMWILFIHRPKNYSEYKKLCRAYGLTMADIRFQEAWAMARWLAREGLYDVDAG